MEDLNHSCNEYVLDSSDAHLHTSCPGDRSDIPRDLPSISSLFKRMSCPPTTGNSVLDPGGSSLYSRATVAFIGVAIFFQSLGVFTENWCHLSWSGQRFRLGLWRGCVEKIPKQWVCSRKYSRAAEFGRLLWICFGVVSYDRFISAGISWGVGAQVLITLSLAVLLLAEILVFGYTCVPRLTPHRLRLLEITFGLCLLTGLLTLIGLIIFGSEVNNYPDDSNARIAWSFGMCVLSLLCVSATTAIVFLDRKLEACSSHNQRSSIFLEPMEEHSRF